MANYLTDEKGTVHSDDLDASGGAFWHSRRFILWLIAVIGLLFWNVISGTQVFVFRDFGLFGYPLAWHHRESFWQGTIPLWNPYNNSGLPFLAQWNTLVLYPFSAIYLLLPMPWSASFFSIVHLFIAGMGMYHLCNAVSSHRFASFVAGTAYAFNGLTLNCLMWPNNIAALAWMPWVVWLIREGTKRGGRKLYAGALLGALQMLTGAPEIILFTWIIVGCLLLPEFPASWRSAFRFGAIVLLVALVAAIQLLPFLDLIRHSQRTGTFSYESAMPPWGWANLLAPLFHSYRSGSGVYFQRGQFWTSSYYAGVGTLLLALGCLIFKRNRTVTILWVICLFSLLFALGNEGYLYRWVRTAFPQLGVMNFPIKFVVPVCFLLPLLAGIGLSSFQNGPRVRFWTVIPLVMIGLLAALLWYSWKSPLESGEGQAMIFNVPARCGFLAVCAILVWQWSQMVPSRRRLLYEFGIILAVAGDLITHMPWQNPAVSPGIYERDLQPVRKLDPVPRFGQSRAMLSEAAIWKFHLTMFDDPFTGYAGPRLAFYDNCNLLEDVPKIDGFYSLYLREEREVGLRLYASETKLRDRIADFLGVSQFSDEKNPLEWKARATAMPLLFGGQKPIFADEKKTLKAILQPEFEPRRELYFPPAAQGKVEATNTAIVQIKNSKFLAHRIEADVEASSNSVISIAQAYYHPWRASLDGKSTELWRANYAFQAVAVPAGMHHLVIEYKDQWFYAGAIISALALGFCFWGLAKKEDRSLRGKRLDSRL